MNKKFKKFVVGVAIALTLVSVSKIMLMSIDPPLPPGIVMTTMPTDPPIGG